MPLVRMSKLITRASQKKQAVGAFSVYNMEALRGVIQAAESTGTPVIIQLAESRFNTAPLELVGPMMVSAARTSELDIAVHLDHATDFDVIRQALDYGFSSVMYDGSYLPLENNIQKTMQIRSLANQYGADLEAEIGLLGKREDDVTDDGVLFTRVQDVELFLREVSVEALAVSIGNQHGICKNQPVLRLDLLADIHTAFPDQALVLHGGSGSSEDDFHQVIKRGVRKINIASAILKSMTEEARAYLISQDNFDFYGMSKTMVTASQLVATELIKIFNVDRGE